MIHYPVKPSVYFKLDLELPLHHSNSYVGKKFFSTKTAPLPEINGKPAIFLIQINFKEVAEVFELPGFPKTGILQWFCGDDKSYGLFDEERKFTQNGILVRYLSEENIESDGEWIDISSITHPSRLPAGVSKRLIFSYKEIFPMVEDSTEEELFSRFSEEEIEEYYEENIENSSGGNHLGGYPFFVQFDPRNPKDPHDLILQLDFEDDIFMFGDCGSAQLFGYPEKIVTGEAKFLWDWAC